MKFDTKLLEQTPCYYYDLDLLDRTLATIKDCVKNRPFKVHYAIKANGEPTILKTIAASGFGADCVSGGEITAALDAGFSPELICYAGVGKTDPEIALAIDLQIGCINVESVEELEVIAAIAESRGVAAQVALRINPDIDAHTHHYITTGLQENKFGIDMRRMDEAVDIVESSKWLVLKGLHFHIGSQITITEPFQLLCERINKLVAGLRDRGIEIRTINVGGGLGIDYDNPDENPIPDFRGFFDTIMSGLNVTDGQEVHCELGRSIVGQCGSLIGRVLFIKEGIDKRFAIIDAGMNDLIRPALYGARHHIDVIDAQTGEIVTDGPFVKYDVVGPICESTDVFVEAETLPVLHRGSLLAFRSAGAYGGSMSSRYNMRVPARPVFAR